MKKYYLAISCFFVISIFSPILISAKSTFSTKTLIEEKIEPIDLDRKLAGFLDFVKDLQKQGLLDGEVLVVRNGQTLLNLQSEDLASSDPSNGPQFMIGSVSKQFFAVALLKSLYESSPYDKEELKIADVKKKLHSPISQFLPEESTVWDGDMPLWADEISLHHLLTHTSGIPNYTDTDEYSNPIDPKNCWFESYRSPSEIIKLVLKEPLLFSPGSKYSYCNTEYVIIAETIEAITSLPAFQYIQEALFDHIGLSSTANPVQGQWDELKADPKLSRLVAPFQYDPRDQLGIYPPLHCEDISTAKGSGSIISSSADLLKWNQVLHKDQSVLPKDLYHLLITANMDNYGYGIGIENTDTGVLLRHSGSIDSYRTLLYYMPEQDLSIIILSNICNDFDKIEDEFKENVEILRDTISDENELHQSALKMILDKYPNMRGFELIAENIRKLFF